MASRFSIYEARTHDDDDSKTHNNNIEEGGRASSEDSIFVSKLLSTFMNKQSALFCRWMQVKIGNNAQSKQLLVITPHRLIFLPSSTSPKRMKQYRMLNIISLFVDERNTNTSPRTSPRVRPPSSRSIKSKFPDIARKQNSIRMRKKQKLAQNDSQNDSFSGNSASDSYSSDDWLYRLSLTISGNGSNSGDQQTVSIYILSFLNARDLLDILHFYISILYRGCPSCHKPNVSIVPSALYSCISNIARTPLIASQVFIDRYVAYCDWRSCIALECVIAYVIGCSDGDEFDVAHAFSECLHELHSQNSIELQFSAIAYALSFIRMFKKLVISRFCSSSMATLMKIYSTNAYLTSLELKKCLVSVGTMQSLSFSLSFGICNLQELIMIEIKFSREMLSFLISGLGHCNLNKLHFHGCVLSEKCIVSLFDALIESKQHKWMRHLNISVSNHFARMGSKKSAMFLYKCLNLQTLIVCDSGIDGNTLLNSLNFSHLQTLTYLDLSCNIIGHFGSQSLSDFLLKSNALQMCKLSGCSISEEQLVCILNGALLNKQSESMRMSLDFSRNNIGNRGANAVTELVQTLIKDNGNCQELNFTIVSLNFSSNNIDCKHLHSLLGCLHCCVNLESLNVSDNIRVRNKMFATKKKDESSKNGKESIGHALCQLCIRATMLERVIISGNDLAHFGLETFISAIAVLSNLKYVDLSDNKLSDFHISLLNSALQSNMTFIRSVRIGGASNRISGNKLIEYLQLLSGHSSLIDVNGCLPSRHILKYCAIKKYSATFTRLQNEACLNLRNNKFQFEIDRKMIASLHYRERMEKQLRYQCGQQFGVNIARIRGSISFVDYESRIPVLLVSLRNSLKTRNGFFTKEIFRCRPDATEFQQFKRDLNANNSNAKTPSDAHSIAAAIKSFYHDLPRKVLNDIPFSKLLFEDLESNKNMEFTDAAIGQYLLEPHKSLFEWLLDLCVEIVHCSDVNRMNNRSMAVVLCPVVYNRVHCTPRILRSIMEFIDFAIQSRIIYRNCIENRVFYVEDAVNVRRKTTIISNSCLDKWSVVMGDLDGNDVSSQAIDDCNHDMTCYCIDRLSFILQCNFDDMFAFICSLRNYNMCALVNDFNHVLRYHSDSISHLETVVSAMMETQLHCHNCTFSCAHLQRNNRNRSEDSKIYFGYKDNSELCATQMLDRMHCFFFHTLSLLRLASSDIYEIGLHECSDLDEFDFEKFTELVSAQREKLAKVRGLHRLGGEVGKFSSVIPSTAKAVKAAPALSSAKYENLKAEMLNNGMFHMSVASFRDCYSKALIYEKCLFARDLGAVSVDSIIAVQLYCDFDDIRFSDFFSVFADSHLLQGLLSLPKAKHSSLRNYYHCIESIDGASGMAGGALMARDKPISVCKHLSMVSLLTSISAQNCVTVAMRVTDTPNVFFESNWISDYANYDEVIVYSSDIDCDLDSGIYRILDFNVSRDIHSLWKSICNLNMIVNGQVNAQCLFSNLDFVQLLLNKQNGKVIDLMFSNFVGMQGKQIDLKMCGMDSVSQCKLLELFLNDLLFLNVQIVIMNNMRLNPKLFQILFKCLRQKSHLSSPRVQKRKRSSVFQFKKEKEIQTTNNGKIKSKIKCIQFINCDETKMTVKQSVDQSNHVMTDVGWIMKANKHNLLMQKL